MCEGLWRDVSGLRVLVALSEDLVLAPSIHTVAHKTKRTLALFVTTVPGGLMPGPYDYHRMACGTPTHMQVRCLNT